MYPHGPQGHRIEVCHDILVRAGRMPSPPRRVESRQPTEAEVRRAEEALEAERERDRAFRAAEERFELFRTQLDAAQTPQAAAEVLRAVVQANIAEASYLPYQLAGEAWRRFGGAVEPTHDLVVLDDQVDVAGRTQSPVPLGRECHEKERLPVRVFETPGPPHDKSIGFLTPMGWVLVPPQFPDGILRADFIGRDREWCVYGAPAIVVHGQAVEVDFVSQPGLRRWRRPLRSKVARLVDGVALSLGFGSNHHTPEPAWVAAALVAGDVTMSDVHDALSPTEAPPAGWGQPSTVGRRQ